MAEFNPDFQFDFGADIAPRQTPWDFTDALRDAATATGTSIDHKIRMQRSRNNMELDDLETTSDEDSQEEKLLPGEEDLDEGSSSDQDREDESQSEESILSDQSDEDAHMKEIEKSEYEETKSMPKAAAGRPGEFFDRTPKETKFSASSFGDLNLSRPLIRACEALGYTTPTPIQAACIPLALTGRDICGSAITGSGKTGAFSLPLLERLLHRDKRVSAVYVLILVPARELAVQVHSMIEKLAQFSDVRASLVVGGLSLTSQAASLRSSPEIVVGTPGRVIDHLRNSQGFGLEDLAALVLDEADRLLEMGFKDEIHEIVRLAPSKRQTLLFSATMTEQVKDLIDLSLRHPVRLAADESAAVPKKLTQEVVRLKGKAAIRKEATLLAMISRSFKSSGRVIIFFSTKQKAHRAKIVFGLCELPLAVELHGDMTQSARLQSLEDFRTGKAACLLATDVAARGLDILGVETVINYDTPRTFAGYLHRIGRTARAGSSGQSITFIEDSDRPLLKEIVKKGKIELLSRKISPVAISSWHSKIEGIERDISEIFKAEREEKELRKAEMEAQKATNMIDHREEIFSRPARTWFQTEKEKRGVAGEAKRAALGLLATEDQETKVQAKAAKNAAKSQRRLERKKAAQFTSEEEGKQGRRNALIKETSELSKKVRAAKAREKDLRESGMPAIKAGRIAARMVSGSKTKKKKRALFSDGSDQTLSLAPSSVYAGGAKSALPKAPSHKLHGTLLNKVRRGGKGKHSFKSKSKHRRR